jgi:23S rRNA pseudouridine1911/1915/1917 synthase
MSWPPSLSETPIDFEVPPRSAGKRIDAYLASRFSDFSRHVIQKIIEAQGVLVQGRAVKASYRVRAGDCVSIRLPDLPDTTPQPEDIPIEVLHEDDALTVVNKPAGMVTHPAKGNWRGTMVNALQFRYDTLSTVGGSDRPGIVHRLDRETSGLLIVVKNDIAHRRLALQFELREVRKEYLALVSGVPQRHSDYIDQAIGFHPTCREKMAIRAPSDGGKAARTFYETVERFRGFALLSCQSLSGRTHQIRVHLAHIGHPILADKLYSGRSRITLSDLRVREQAGELAGSESGAVLLDRQALHAHRLRFRHPLTGQELDLTAPLPEDMTRTLEALRTHRPA